MKDNDWDFLACLLKQHTGMVLPVDKGYLIETRLVPIARSRLMAGHGALIDALRMGHDKELVREVIEAMTTTESYFFRDGAMFECLRTNVLPRLLVERAQTRHLRIWSAACSSGQEPYSVAMLLAQLAPELAGWKTEILATDLSCESLKRARAGRYSQFDVQRGLPIRLLLKHFEPTTDGHWRLEEPILDRVEFRETNLLDGFEDFGTFDLILCRNVLIHFDAALTGSTLDRMAGALRAGGYLFLGGAESVVGVSERFEPIDGLGGFFGLAGQGQSGATVPYGQIERTAAG